MRPSLSARVLAAAACGSLFALALLAPATLAAWPSDPAVNLPVCVAANDQVAPVVLADGEGGAYLAWADLRSGIRDIYATHLRADGTSHAGWPAGGLAVCSAGGTQEQPKLASDGAGGAFLVWRDARGGTGDVYAHHLVAGGTLDPAWPANGVAVCTAPGDQFLGAALADGAGGALIAWHDARVPANSYDIFAHRLTAAGVDAAWPADGRLVCGATQVQQNPLLVSDGAGGAIVVWEDLRSGVDYGVYAARVLAGGALDPFWPAGGRALSDTTGQQWGHSAATDGHGGAIVAWRDDRAGSGDIYAQHVSRSGESMGWPVHGKPVATLPAFEANPVVAGDGAGGAYIAFLSLDSTEGSYDLWIAWVQSDGGFSDWLHYPYTYGYGFLPVAAGPGATVNPVAGSVGAGNVLLAWRDSRGGSYDIFAARYGPGGPVPGWPALDPGGLAVATESHDVESPALALDGCGGLVAAWQDRRNGDRDIFAQRVTGYATLGAPEPVIAAVRDVEGDQGGRVHVLWTPALGDGDGRETIGSYSVWRRAPDSDPGTWEWLAGVPARGAPGYAWMAPTAGDSTSAGVPRATFRVMARDTVLGAWLVSVPDSGYSVDDLAPQPPSGFRAARAGGIVRLFWDASRDADVAAFRLYRGDVEEFPADAAHLVAEVAGTSWDDPWPAPCWYRLRALDAHGNEGPAAATAAGGEPAASTLAASTWPYHPMMNLPVTLEGPAQGGPRLVPDGGGGAIACYEHWNSVTTEIRAHHVLASGTMDAAWPPAGTLLCTAPGARRLDAAVALGGGRALAAWSDQRTGSDDVYAMAVEPGGLPGSGWPANGLALCGATGAQAGAVAVADGSGGALVAWEDKRSGNSDVYMTRVTGSGALASGWTASGTAVLVAAEYQVPRSLIGDGAAGAIVAWAHYQSSTNQWSVVVQRMRSNGMRDPAWPAEGVVVCSEGFDPVLVPDGSGGAIVVFEGRVDGVLGAIAHHVTHLGTLDPAWPTGGRRLWTTSWNLDVTATSDGAGGVVVFCGDDTGPSTTLRVQRLTADGAVAPGWPAEGAVVCDLPGDRWIGAMLPDGAGGALVAWSDGRTFGQGLYGYDVYAHRVLGSGTLDPGWPANGRAVSLAADDQLVLSAVTDGAGGMIVGWEDERFASAMRGYVQRVESSGALGHPEPAIASVADVANDQGGSVRVVWQASPGEFPPFHGITDYTLWRRLAFEEAMARRARGAPLHAGDTAGRPRPGTLRALGAAAAGTWWEYLASVPASGLGQYAFVAPTTADATPGVEPWNVFFVDAADSSYGMHLAWTSAPDSGFSSDNLAPRFPAPCVAEYDAGTVRLHWPPNEEPDFAYYRLYRGYSMSFTPGPENLIATRTDTGYTDVPLRPAVYIIQSWDVHGNVSPNGLIVPDGLVGLPAAGTPAALRLDPARPNPMSGEATIGFALPRAARVRLVVHDAAGRLVRTLADGTWAAGEHAARWDGRDGRSAATPAGVYFVRLEVAGEVRTGRIARVR